MSICTTCCMSKHWYYSFGKKLYNIEHTQWNPKNLLGWFLNKDILNPDKNSRSKWTLLWLILAISWELLRPWTRIADFHGLNNSQLIARISHSNVHLLLLFLSGWERGLKAQWSRTLPIRLKVWGALQVIPVGSRAKPQPHMVFTARCTSA